MKNLYRYGGLILTCTLLSGCVTKGVVPKKGDDAFRTLVSAKGYTPLPNPISALDVGELYLIHGEGSQRSLAPVPACRGLFSAYGQVPPVTSPWGIAYQTTAAGFNASVGFRPKKIAGTTPIDDASASAGYVQYDSYQINMGEVVLNQMDANEYDDFSGVLTERCLDWIQKVESKGRLENVILVAATATSPNLSFSYDLNPLPGAQEALIAEAGTLSPAERAAYEGKCGPGASAELGLLKALNIDVSGAYCVRGNQKITSTVPYVIGIIAYNAAQLRADNSISAGIDGQVVLEQTSKLNLSQSLDALTVPLDENTLAEILAE